MVKAVWKDIILAESDNTVMIEGNHYFPPDSINWDYFSQSDKHTRCPWKGEASYYHVVVDGEVNSNAAWYYPNPKKEADEIQGHVAFWHGVEVSEE